MSFIGGKLKFKGNFQQKLNDQLSKIRQILNNKEDKAIQQILKQKHQATSSDDENDNVIKTNTMIEQPIQHGVGRILTTNMTVHGLNTKFQTDKYEPGDKIIIQHPTTLVKEERLINLVFSNRSLLLVEPFSSDIISYTLFDFQKKPIQQEGEQSLEGKYEERMKTLGKSKKIKKDKTEIEYRVRKNGMWGYNTKKVQVEGTLSKEQLLDLRSKQKSDKHCWV